MFHTPSFFLLCGLLVFASLGCSQPGSVAEEETIRILILSGRNNHDWQGTTKVIAGMFRSQKNFEVFVSEKPDTLVRKDLLNFDVLLSNWNSWPENNLRWSEEGEAGILEFIRQGGGMVFFHASTSVFYDWPDFADISTAAWVEETWHGKKCPVQVEFGPEEHPITSGFSGFRIIDELWINAGQNEDFTLLGSASLIPAGEEAMVSAPDKEHARLQPAVFVREYGAGRIFHTILGHDPRAVRNTGFQYLLLRGTEWAARGKVSITLPQELNTCREHSGFSSAPQAGTAKGSAAGVPNRNQSDADQTDRMYSWFETDSTFGLSEKDRVIWQFNQGTIYGKPFFHPVYLGNERMTCLAPDDHPWHLGQWFSWKFIDSLNYWEFDRDTYRSEGVTEVTAVNFKRKEDFSAEVNLEIEYHPPGEAAILMENRTIRIGPPSQERLSMDYQMEFTATDKDVLLDRTPIEGEPDGKSWGGYAGLSLRFNQDFSEPGRISPLDLDAPGKGEGGNWYYMGFKGLHGGTIGSAIFIAPEILREGSGWYGIERPDLPFWYFSPAYLYNKPCMIPSDDTLLLNYRLVHYADEVTREMLLQEYGKYRQTLVQ